MTFEGLFTFPVVETALVDNILIMQYCLCRKRLMYRIFSCIAFASLFKDSCVCKFDTVTLQA